MTLIVELPPAALRAVAAADVICTAVLDALALLHEPARMTATLRP